ncbi:MAG TPA: hypothetical protein VGJ94_06725 [Syntrophorhabdaceae bacterium]|jgi:hypothetical protein
MKINFITPLYNLTLACDLGGGDKLDDHTRITNSRKVISDFVQGLELTIGKLEFDYLCSGVPVFYSVEDVPEGITPEQYLITKLYHIQAFINIVWLHFDNSINTETGYVFYSDGRGLRVSSNFIALRFSNCRGECRPLELTRNQLQLIRKLYREAIALDDHPFDRGATQLVAGINRFSRAVYYVDAARSEIDLAMRISHYCSALEALFATSQSELSHQLSERVACFIHKGPDDRIKTYREVKHAYGIRSKIVHGSTIKPTKMEELRTASAVCDDLLRTILLRLLLDFEARKQFGSNPEILDEYMLRTIFK